MCKPHANPHILHLEGGKNIEAKILNKVLLEEIYVNIIKVMNEKLRTFPLRSRISQGYTLTMFIQHDTRVLAIAIRQVKE